MQLAQVWHCGRSEQSAAAVLNVSSRIVSVWRFAAVGLRQCFEPAGIATNSAVLQRSEKARLRVENPNRMSWGCLMMVEVEVKSVSTTT